MTPQHLDFAELYRTLFEHSADGVLLTWPDGRVLRANPAACQAFGLTEEEVRSVGPQALVVRDALLGDFLVRRERDGVAKGELHCRRADGTVFPVEATSALMPG